VVRQRRQAVRLRRSELLQQAVLVVIRLGHDNAQRGEDREGPDRHYLELARRRYQVGIEEPAEKVAPQLETWPVGLFRPLADLFARPLDAFDGGKSQPRENRDKPEDECQDSHSALRFRWP